MVMERRIMAALEALADAASTEPPPVGDGEQYRVEGQGVIVAVLQRSHHPLVMERPSIFRSLISSILSLQRSHHPLVMERGAARSQ